MTIARILRSQRRRLTLIRSSGLAECGLTCLAMIAVYHGHKVSLSYLRAKYPQSINGIDLRTLTNIARELHLIPNPVRLDINGMAVLRTPCILHWDKNHFVVLKSISKRRVTIVDPAYGVRRMRPATIAKLFSGVALELERAPDFCPITLDERPLLLRDFFVYIKGLGGFLGRLLTLTLIIQSFALLSPLFIRFTVDEAIPNAAIDLIIGLAVGFAMLTIYSTVLTLLRGVTSMCMGTTLSFRMNSGLLWHLLSLPLSFFESRHIGDIDSRFRSMDNIKAFLGGDLVSVFLDLTMVVASLAFMLSYSAVLTIFVASAISLDFTLRMVTLLKIREITEDRIEAGARATSKFLETIRAMTAIKIFGQETRRHKLWQDLAVDQYSIDIRLGKWNMSLRGLRDLVAGLENALVIAFAGIMIIGDSFSVGMLFAFIAYKGQFLGSLNALADKFTEFRMLRLHLQRLSEIALAQSEDDESTAPLPRGEVRGHLELRDIRFRYGVAEPYVLENCNLTIEPGQSVALVGPSGCGKTTLMKVAIGLLEPDDGAIFLDGVDISLTSAKQYRRCIGAVMQEDALLSGTLAENISFFDPDANMGRVEECASLASIHDDIVSMPMRYQTLIGDMGSSLSGGQKQRVLLARALYADPKILFLDEATSHLDAENEKLAFKAIRDLSITRLIIAHRTETVAAAERVFAFVGDGPGRFVVRER